MASSTPIPLVFGGAVIKRETHSDAASTQKWFDALRRNNIDTIDTAKIYGESEKILGEADVHGNGFIIDTKSPGGLLPGSTLTAEALYNDAHASAKLLGTAGGRGLDIYYIHAPDVNAKVEDWVPVMDKLHKEGVFKRFGLSNFDTKQVQHVYDYAEKNGLLKPTVYQGNYNALARHPETELIPALRKLGIVWYAYSPIAGGFLTKKPEQFKEAVGRFRPGEMIGELYIKMYSSKDAMLQALSTWNSIADKEGIPTGELAYRWISYHSALKNEYGDKLISGARSLEQLDQMAGWIAKGPLKEESVKEIDVMWDNVKAHAYETNIDAFKDIMAGK